MLDMGEAFKATEECVIALEAMKDIKAEYMNTVYTTLGSIVIAIGWILTSLESRNFIAKHERIRSIMLAAILFFCIFHFKNLLQIAERARNLNLALDNLCHNIPFALSDIYVIKDWWPWASITFNGVMFLGLLSMILTIKKEKE